LTLPLFRPIFHRILDPRRKIKPRPKGILYEHTLEAPC
jgi:hypothetical protein